MGYAINGYGDHGFNRVPRVEQVRYIVVHYTADGKPDSHTAYNAMLYFGRANRNASAHYFLDNHEIWQFEDPRWWSCWHVGDGHGAYGITNANSVGIEVVQDCDEPFSDKEIDKLHWLVSVLMDQFNVPAERVVRHYDASRKLCPWYYTPGGSGGDAAWRELHEVITSPYDDPDPIEALDLGVYRIYNPNSGEHMFTADVHEARALRANGWRYEGVAFLASEDGIPTYRLYNPYAGDHHFTTSANERDTLRKVGWSYEGIGWLAGGDRKVYRLYNQNATSGSHMLTIWPSERDALKDAGWTDEGIAFQGGNPPA